MKRTGVWLLVGMLVVGAFTADAEARRPRPSQGAKYVFFFIGDGMGMPQIHATEAYLAQLAQPDDPDNDLGPNSIGTAGSVLLNMSQFPVVGMQRTYADNRFITGSAASATALACGKKTTIGTIAMDNEHTMDYATIAELAQQKGMSVGVVSSVSIDHATPACFYAHQPSRNNYWNISDELSLSGFEYFGGGGPKGERSKYWPDPNDSSYDPVQRAINRGYTVVRTKADLQAVAPGTKTFVWGDDVYTQDLVPTDKSYAMPYEIDRDPSKMSLADYTAEGVRLLGNDPDGFFMMVEGGKIDWACHANDARSAIDDTIAFDDAVAVAVDFYMQHPSETLIVVTGDHECGGMTLGFAATDYDTAFEILSGQTMSYEWFMWTELSAHAAARGINPADWDAELYDMDADIKARVLAAFGLDYATLTAYEQEQLESAYDKTMSGEGGYSSSSEDYVNYGYYDQFTVTITHVMNRRAGIAFTSYSHTGVPVPVYALGYDAWRFDGYYENTAVAERIAKAMRVHLNN